MQRRLRRRRRAVIGLGLGILFFAPLAAAEDPVQVAQAAGPQAEEKTPAEGEQAPDGAQPQQPPPPRLASGIEEIVIRGSESQATSDFDAADSVTGFGAEDIAALGAQDIAGLAEFTPNLEIVTSGATTPTFFIRGVGLNDFNANSTGAVAIYQDDVAINAPALQLGTLFDVEAVNILRGPQGTGPARNASAGAIKIYSRKPTGEYGAFLRSELGDYDSRDFEGAVEAPIDEDTLAARLAFRLSERDGWMTNRCGNAPPPSERVPAPTATQLKQMGKTSTDAPWSICGEPVGPSPTNPNQPKAFSDIPAGLPDRVNSLGNWAARGTLLFEPTLDTSFVLNAHGSRRDELTRLGQSYGTNGFFYPDGLQTLNDPDKVDGLLGAGQSTTALYQPREVVQRLRELAPCLTPQPNFPQGTCNTGTNAEKLAKQNLLNSAKIQVAHELSLHLDSDPWAGDFNRVGPTQNDTWGSMLRGEVALPWGMQLTSVSGYDSYDRLIDIDLDFSPETLFQIVTDDQGWQAVQDLRLEGEMVDAGPLRWEVGGWLLREHLDVTVVNDLGIQGTFGAGRRDYTQDLWSTAGYANLSFDFWRDYTLDGGIRYNWEQKKMDYLLTQGFGGTFPDTPHETWSAPTGTVRLTYRFREDTHAYWKYTRGWKPGTFNATSSIAQGVSIADPETLDSFETGVRGSWLEGRFDLDLSVFYYDYKNYQLFTAQQFAGGQPEFVILNADKAEVYGAELDAMLRPWLGSFFEVRFGWLESQFLDFVQLQQDIIQDPVTHQQVVVNKELNNTGNRLLNSPRFKLSLTGEQKIPLGRWGSLTARYDGVWTDITYYDATQGVGIPNDQNIHFLPKTTIAQPAYWVHNLRLAYKPPGSRVEIAGWVRNLTNQAYKTFAFDGNTFNETTIYFVGEPRTVGGTLTVTF